MKNSKKSIVEPKVYDARVWYQIRSCEGVQAPLQRTLSEYNNLLREVSSHHESVGLEQFERVLRQTNELVVLMFDQSELVGTAQSSLVFPGCWPVVLIEKVVVANNCRGRGWGRFLMHETERLLRERFANELPLTLRLTSREERQTEAFYSGLGFKKTATNRYQKQIEASMH